jgi:hypothetical protein
LGVFLADAVFVFFTGLVVSAVAVVVPVAVAGVVDDVDDPAAHGRTSGAPVLETFAAFAASFFRIARDRHRAFVALPASFVPAATQMHALFDPQALSSRLRHGEAFAVLGLSAGFAESSATAGDAVAEDAAASGAGLAAGAVAAAFFSFVLCLTGAAGGGGADALSVA